MSSGEQYDADYFLRGKESGKSLYENYRWMPELTVPMCHRIVEHCRIEKRDRIMDYGCARGYTVKALRGMGYDAYGLDVSAWAIENADPEVKTYLAQPVCGPTTLHSHYDWIIAKDVLEHIPFVQLTIDALMKVAVRGIFAVVPLRSVASGMRYVIEDYEKDVTHVQRHMLIEWADMFLRPGWSVEASYRVRGVKDNYYKPGWELGNGFLTVRRIAV